MEIVLFIIVAMLVAQLFFVLWNGSYLSSLTDLAKKGQSDAGAKPQQEPLVSVLIPARNEESNIDACLESVLSQQDLALEVLVLDDGSTDGTPEKVASWTEQDQRLCLIKGRAKPEGWMGKSYACHQLAQQAQGTWWLFLDADTRLRNPKALAKTLAVAKQQGKGMITGIPYQRTGTWMEKLILPMMMFTILCHLPLRLLHKSSNPLYSAAHGAFLFLHRDSYRAFGGHEAFRSHLLDDMQMAQALKKAGHRLTFAAIHQDVEMRMYHNAQEVWQGFKKNTFSGLGRSYGLLLLITTFYSLLYLLPPALFLFYLLVKGTFLPTALVGWVLAMVIKGFIDRKSDQPLWLAPLLPLSIFFMLLIAWDSARSAFLGKGYAWKGRQYG
ncbi:glycosyltransferase [Heliorestis convoluta]|uniref:Glycosyl transferase family 2 protein n=1 Tax=Heliorestis convoluta TaxID=356322 RepID=A0A5Q2MYK3_9FIRM|nr:glycosyltransferase family 2 protein [Heliorestis convoluta]QGG46483.1 glycosyl transferase family 2 protein [Heliorestis convoluta]